MKKIFVFAVCLLAWSTTYSQSVTKVDKFLCAGPYEVASPVFSSKDAKGKEFQSKSLMDAAPLKSKLAREVGDGALPEVSQQCVFVYSFFINDQNFKKVDVEVKGAKTTKTYLDGKESPLKGLKLDPRQHRVDIKILSDEKTKDSIFVNLKCDKPVEWTVSEKHGFGMDEVLYGLKLSNASISEDGKYVIITYNDADHSGKALRKTALKEVATGKVIREQQGMFWLNEGNDYAYYRTEDGNRRLYRCTVAGEEAVIAENLPKGRLMISPDLTYMVMSEQEDGPKEDADVYQILDPDDRQPGWRNRSYVSLYDIATGMTTRLSFGSRSVSVMDISDDSRYLLMALTNLHVTKRPSSGMDICVLDLKTRTVDTLIKDDGFLRGAQFSPDGKSLLCVGSPESFGGIGKNVDKGQTPNMYDIQMYIFDIATRKVKCLTKDFNPSVEAISWNRADGKVYAGTTESEYMTLYAFNPKGGWKKLSQIPEVVTGWNLPAKGRTMCYVGGGASSPSKLYIKDIAKDKDYLFEDCTAERYKNVEMGECHPWSFTNRLGDEIQGRFYLPLGFDPGKKYPMIVNYYGGCTPITRSLESRYPQQYWATLGYVVYVVQPSGAIGFGQKFSARHVETWGDFVADDIIEGIQKFCDSHPFVDKDKIGCIGASYGGFMTQYLQTKTDLFACAISHAGISNIASYWGEGYWGYSYGHVASGESYPWNNPEMYTRQSPLFNADKIHTPLLLLHGSADTNVPHIESIQMFTALKILGREVAFVEVKGENHWILDYPKRIKWSNTIMAWFQKYLKDDPSWWESMYPQKNL